MTQPKFSIGVDLGTSNSVLAFTPLSGDGGSAIIAILQWDTQSTMMESVAVPSFLYLPEDAIAAQTRDRGLGSGEWVIGRLAKRKASETPGRVVQSAKSWLCHHAADRTAPFLPWLSDTVAEHDKISPVTASALILAHLRATWNDRFAGQGPGVEFDAQDITITVPASFDAAAQRLTLLAAQQAGFPDHVRLLEEPQAAFYAWLEQKTDGADPWRALPDPGPGPAHILVIDIGGGTSDFSLFELSRHEGGGEPEIKRVAVSDHILLGGDNIDLAIAHLAGTRLATVDAGLSAAQWDHLIAQCRSLKERALGDGEPAPDETFTVSIPGRSSSVFANSLSTAVTRAELEGMILEGFFPECLPTDRPRRLSGAVREWGLPYASDSAITRHLAAFLRDRPAVDAVLFNGGSLLAPRLRERLREQIGVWQDGRLPQALENAELDLAVARGAAYSGKLLRKGARRIEGGAARAVFVEAHRTANGDNEAARRPLICILPHGAPAGELIELSDLDLHLRVNRPVRFQVYTSTRHDETKAGDVVELTPEAFHALPPLETVATAPQAAGGDSTIPVVLNAKINELGLLQLSCRSLAAQIPQSWPLEFNLRPREGGAAPVTALAETQAEPDVPPASLAEAEQRINAAFTKPLNKREKLTAPRLIESLEQILGRSKGDWNATLLRDLWTSLAASQKTRASSVEHEETWLIIAGFLLRPGFGLAMDELRLEQLWRICNEGLRFPGKRTKLQEYVLWRRVAGGLSQERQEALLAAEKHKIFEQKNVSAELIRMVGAFERIGQDLKRELVERFIETVVELASEKKHCAPYLAALGFLLTRTPFYAGPENIAPPTLVEKAYEAFRRFDWKDAEFTEAQTLFLRAARAVDDRRLDLPSALRSKIADKLEKCGIAPVKTGRLRTVEPVQRAERLSFYGEAVPSGLILSGSGIIRDPLSERAGRTAA